MSSLFSVASSVWLRLFSPSHRNVSSLPPVLRYLYAAIVSVGTTSLLERRVYSSPTLMGLASPRSRFMVVQETIRGWRSMDFNACAVFLVYFFVLDRRRVLHCATSSTSVVFY